MVTQANGSQATEEQPKPEKTFTEAEVQARISAATAKVQSQLAAAAKKAETADAKATEVEAKFTRANTELETLREAEGIADDAKALAKWKSEQQGQVGADRAAVKAERQKFNEDARAFLSERLLHQHPSLTHVDLEHLETTKDFEIFSNALEAAAKVAPPATNAEGTPPAPDGTTAPAPEQKPNYDRGGGAGRATGGDAPSNASLGEKVGAQLANDPAWRAHFESYPG